jgi:hypothetical protein
MIADQIETELRNLESSLRHKLKVKGYEFGKFVIVRKPGEWVVFGAIVDDRAVVPRHGEMHPNVIAIRPTLSAALAEADAQIAAVSPQDALEPWFTEEKAA